MHSSDNILDHFDFEDNPFLEEDGTSLKQGLEVILHCFSMPDRLEADLAAARLRAEGIPCFLANTASQSVLTHLPILVRLHVRPADFQRAQAILAEAAIDANPEVKRKSVGLGVFHALAIAIAIIVLALLAVAIGMA